jgi:hypothetical protein
MAPHAQIISVENVRAWLIQSEGNSLAETSGLGPYTWDCRSGDRAAGWASAATTTIDLRSQPVKDPFRQPEDAVLGSWMLLNKVLLICILPSTRDRV